MILRLAWRSLWRHRRRTWITTITIGLGLAFVVFFVSLAEGVYQQLVEDAVRMQAGHVTLEHPAYREAPAIELRVRDVTGLRQRIRELPLVERTKLLVLGQGVARSGSGAVGVSLMGVEPDVESAGSPLARRIVAGSYLTAGDRARVVVGSVLAERLRLEPGKKLVLATNDARGDLVEGLFRVAGVFETGADEIDGTLVQAPLSPVQRLYGLAPDEATQLGVVLRDADAVRRAIADVRHLLDGHPVAVRSWREVLPELAAFIRLDRASDLTFQGLLIVLVLFTIYNTILMSVLERDREHAVLLALGTPPGLLRRQILAESALLGLMGCALGLALGGGLAGWVQAYGWDLSGLYSEGMTVSGFAVSMRIHARVTAAVLLALAGIVFGATLFLSLWPVRRAVRVPIVETLRGGAA